MAGEGPHVQADRTAHSRRRGPVCCSDPGLRKAHWPPRNRAQDRGTADLRGGRDERGRGPRCTEGQRVGGSAAGGSPRSSAPRSRRAAARARARPPCALRRDVHPEAPAAPPASAPRCRRLPRTPRACPARGHAARRCVGRATPWQEDLIPTCRRAPHPRLSLCPDSRSALRALRNAARRSVAECSPTSPQAGRTRGAPSSCHAAPRASVAAAKPRSGQSRQVQLRDVKTHRPGATRHLS